MTPVDKDTEQQSALFEVGQTASLTKAFGAAEVEAFAEMTGDRNPVHLDPEYARQTRFGMPIVHGMLVSGLISAVTGTRLPGPGTIYLHQDLDFRRPVYVGDSITAVVKVTHSRRAKSILTLDTRCYNQQNKVVVEGEAVVLFETAREEGAAHRE